MQIFQDLGSYPDLGRESKRRIAIISTDIKGPIANGGVGTSNVALAESLAERGHDVTLVFVNPWFGNDAEVARWARHYRKKKIRLIRAVHPSFRMDGLGPSCISYVSYLHLKENKYDIVHFADMHGVGYHSLLAKRYGLDFADTLLCVTLHGPSVWHRENNRSSVPNTDLVQFDYLERSSVEMADILFAPSQSILQWSLQAGWKLPEQVYVIPNPTSEIVGIPYKNRRKNLQEIVFFGRLEFRKGLNLFCDALDRVPASFMKDKRVTFLGCHGLIGTTPSKDYLQERSKKWRFHWQVVSNLNQEAALQFLRSGHSLAVLPSTAESMGYTFIECLASGIPLLANHLPSYKELLDPEDHRRILVDAWDPEQFAHAIVRLSKNSGKIPRFRKTTSDIVKTWQNWHSRVRLPEKNLPVSRKLRELQPTVEVLNAELGNEESRVNSLQWEKQKYQNFILRDGNFQELVRYAKNSRAEYLLFTNSKTTPYPEMIQSLVRLVQEQECDIATATLDRRELMDGVLVRGRQIGVGYDPCTAYFCNPFGSCDFLISKAAFLKLEEKGILFYGSTDWDFLMRAGQESFKICTHLEPSGQTMLTAWESYFGHNLKDKWSSFQYRFSKKTLEPLAAYAELTKMQYAEMELHNSNRHHLGQIHFYDRLYTKVFFQRRALVKSWQALLHKIRIEWKLLKDRKLPERAYWRFRILLDQSINFVREYPLWPFRKLWWMIQYQYRKRLVRAELVELNDGI